MVNAPDEIISAYVDPVPAGQPKGGIVTMVYDVVREAVVTTSQHADDNTVELHLTSLEEKLAWGFPQGAVQAERSDIARIDIECTVHEADLEYEQMIMDDVHRTVRQLLSKGGRPKVTIDSAVHGKYVVHGTSHAKPKAA